MRIRHWAVGLIVLFIVFLVVSAPARLLSLLLPQPQVIARGFHGGLWNGKADEMAIAVNGGYLQLGRVEWSLSPWSLLFFSPRMEVKSEWGIQRLDGDITFSPGGELRLRDTEISLDAAIAKRFLPIQVDGQLSVLVPDLSIEGSRATAGSARLVWQRARWYSSRGPKPLGSYVAEIEVGEPGQLGAKVSTLSGPVNAEGNISLFGRALTVDIKLSGAKSFHPEFAQALQLMAAPTEDGYHLKMNLEL